ncbi:MAG: hypothetical protein K940chlam7_00109 [Chlamydiae bacterium]|nr:hypothetical protein [Chlamydiota bacterium]
MLKKRYLTAYIYEDLKEKMVFIGGARQVGKTTLSKELLTDYFERPAYFNWDYKKDRQDILASRWPGDADLVILDEIHKYSKWKTLIKGNYDKWKDRYRFVITGSARLNLFRRGGDSLQGRYHYYRLHPFSLAECLQKKNKIQVFEEIPIADQQGISELEALFGFGGFPEPLLKQTERHLRRWHREKVERLFREDIRELEMIRELGQMQLLCDLLPRRVSSLLSLNALREDLEVSHRAVSHWVKVLESFYYCYRIYPFSHRVVRSLKKEPKLYLWDWSEVEDEGARFENMVASHLLKLVHFLHDYEGYDAQLHYLRDREKREVDFLVTVDGKPWFLCEAKLTNHQISSHLKYFQSRLKIPYAYQIVMHGEYDYLDGDIRVVSATKFLSSLF